MSDIPVYRFVRPVAVSIVDDRLTVRLEDERVIATPLVWYHWLMEAPESARSNVELLPDAIFWPELDEGLEIEGMLRGLRPAQLDHLPNP